MGTAQPAMRPSAIRPARRSAHCLIGETWDAREIRPRGQARVRTCGHCAEWSARSGMLEAASRGQCLHPGSGFSYPPADMEACAFFH